MPFSPSSATLTLTGALVAMWPMASKYILGDPDAFFSGRAISISEVKLRTENVQRP